MLGGKVGWVFSLLDWSRDFMPNVYTLGQVSQNYSESVMSHFLIHSIATSISIAVLKNHFRVSLAVFSSRYGSVAQSFMDVF
jgi:hypothetical protein